MCCISSDIGCRAIELEVVSSALARLCRGDPRSGTVPGELRGQRALAPPQRSSNTRLGGAWCASCFQSGLAPFGSEGQLCWQSVLATLRTRAP